MMLIHQKEAEERKRQLVKLEKNKINKGKRGDS